MGLPRNQLQAQVLHSKAGPGSLGHCRPSLHDLGESREVCQRLPLEGGSDVLHSFIHLISHSLSPSLPHSFINSLVHLFTHSFVSYSFSPPGNMS